MTEFTDRVQQAVGEAYRIEKELGGGGMSRVFLAEETRLGRQVVIKVLPPEMAAGVNVERFEREIQLAARLQHPHIVPLLSAGSKDDLLYYVMPYIQGESLRAKLAREGELPVAEAVRILKDVLDALSYAHEQGIVHRDIKPDNVMIARRHAVVTDFGVAKAVQSSTGESSLTSLGVALGTPAYMSPEQAAADPHVDHRADIYALGAMAYEMLTGRPPFTGGTPQAVLSAHVTQAPDHVTLHRNTVPPMLADLVMHCLAKKPADRPQHAEELIPRLDTLLTPSGGMTPTGTQPVAAVNYTERARKAHPLRVGVLFALAGFGIAAMLYAIVRALGLPDWVLFAGIGLLLAGFPIFMLTGVHERKRAIAQATGVHTMTPTGMKKLFTWRRAMMSGGAAFLGLGVVAGAFMALRALGIGPFGTLVSSGKLAARAKILVADFDNHTTDPTLGRSLTEAFRIDLSQSPVVRVMTASEIGAVLRRMEKPDSTRVDATVAKDIAEREGVPAIITGDISPVGRGYVLAARVLSTGDGSELAADRETAESDDGILDALSRLTKSIRQRIGESYKSLRDTKPLENVTTSSLNALRLYTRGSQAEAVADYPQAVELYRQATQADTNFAMAYRKLAVTLGHVGAPKSKSEQAAEHAYRLRDRLPPAERYLAEAYYYQNVVNDVPRAIAAYRSVLAIDPDQYVALVDLGGALLDVNHWAAAESLCSHALAATDSTLWNAFNGLAQAQFWGGHADEAHRTLAAWERKLPNMAVQRIVSAEFEFFEGHWDSVEALARAAKAEAPGGVTINTEAAALTALSLLVRGRVSDAESVERELGQEAVQRGDTASAVRWALWRPWVEVLIRGNPDRAARVTDSIAKAYPLDQIDASQRPWGVLVMLYASAGRAADARALLERWGREVPTAKRWPRYRWATANVLDAEGHHAEARAAYEALADSVGCNACVEPDIARTWDEVNQPDSALAHYARYLTSSRGPSNFDPRIPIDRPHVLQRAGELAEQLAHRQQAIKWYSEFVDLWKNADPELQPFVKDVKARIARLTTEHG